MTASTGERHERTVERPLLVLMAARLVLAMSGLLIGLLLDLTAIEANQGPWRAFYATVALMFLATVVYRPFVGRIRRLRVFGAINMLTDMLLVSGLVLFSGGVNSVFTFCYVVVGLYGGLLFPGWGAVLCAASGAVAYAGVLWAGQAGWLGPAVAPEPMSVLVGNWLAHASALLGSSALSGFLARELARTGKALNERTQDLAELRSLHERTVESLRSGLLTTDLRGRITSFNREAESITGWSRARALGRPVSDLIPDLHEHVWQPGGSDQVQRFRMEFVGPAGKQVHLGFGSYVLRDAGGEVCGDVVIFQDVTEVVAMEQDLRRSERLAAVGELSASIAHEIRNPLAAISGSVQMMDAQLQNGQGESKRLREIVIREVDRLDLLIHDFLQFARPGEPRLEIVSVAEVVGEVVEMAEAARSPATSIEQAIEAELHVHVDPAQFRQLLWNLLRNAMQAMPEGGCVRFEARGMESASPQGETAEGRIQHMGKPAWAEIAVMDQGGGIPSEVVEHMFDPFYTTKVGGSGLGLAIVHRMVHDHGGGIRVQQDCGEFATAIRVTLPSGGGSS